MEKTTKTKRVSKKVAPVASEAKKAFIVSAPIYNQSGKEVGEVKLPENIFSVAYNSDLINQVVYSMLSDSRTTYAHTKDRGEVRGGGRKPWKQKGTGRARHGSTRSPIWVKGGVAHGPNGLKNYARKVNKKMKAKALFSILSRKMMNGEVMFIDNFEIKAPKTADAVSILKNLSAIKSDLLTKRNNSAIIAISGKKPSFEKSFQNLGNVIVDEVRNINPVELLNKKYLIIENPEESIKFLAAKMEK